MVAELARGDWEDLRAAGLPATLEDFDRLNQLALRLEAGPETTPANHPRIGWAGDVPFYEPTCAALMWLQDFARRVPCDAETQQTFYYFALAHGRTPAAFDALTAPDKIETRVKAWLRGLPCTVAEMARACNYAAFGFDDAEPAQSAQKMAHRQRANKSVAAENLERLERRMAQAAALTGFSYADLMAQTPSRLNALVLTAQVEAGATLSQDSAKAQIDYTCTLNEIRARLEKERANVE